MCVVATYVIMHVIVYFGVCKCHGCSSHLCKWMFKLVREACDQTPVVVVATYVSANAMVETGTDEIELHSSYLHI